MIRGVDPAARPRWMRQRDENRSASALQRHRVLPSDDAVQGLGAEKRIDRETSHGDDQRRPDQPKLGREPVRAVRPFPGCRNPIARRSAARSWDAYSAGIAASRGATRRGPCPVGSFFSDETARRESAVLSRSVLPVQWRRDRSAQELSEAVQLTADHAAPTTRHLLARAPPDTNLLGDHGWLWTRVTNSHTTDQAALAASSCRGLRLRSGKCRSRNAINAFSSAECASTPAGERPFPRRTIVSPSSMYRASTMGWT
jgi:hypothetical protein